MNLSRTKLTIPKPAAGEILRKALVDSILSDNRGIIYVQAGAGYGKTTLLSQIAHANKDSVWATLDGEENVYSFLNIVSKAIELVFPEYYFNASEYFPLEKSNYFITTLANSFVNNIDKLNHDFILFLDDLHTIKSPQVRQLIACILKYKPETVRFCMSSREAPWQELLPLSIRGRIQEITQQELAFAKNEILQILGFEDEGIYQLTEGWPIAIGSLRLLMENGMSITDLSSHGSEALYSYLSYECVSHLPYETVEFLKNSACFEELEPHMLDELLGINNSRQLLEYLIARNIFTIKTAGGSYRYHALFREYLLGLTDCNHITSLQSLAAKYCYDQRLYTSAARYAAKFGNTPLLEKIILVSYRNFIRDGSFHELRVWFQVLEDAGILLSKELLVAKGAFLSSIGNFTEAQICLDKAIPSLNAEENRDLYIEAMVHKSRVLRNFISFEESNMLLDILITGLDHPHSEQAYSVIIEKIYNLCWNSQINEAYALTFHIIDVCAQAGNLKVKAWYERYLSVLHYVAGRMKDSVYYYEKSRKLPENEQQYLDMHSIDVYVAKAYQMLGERDKAVSLVTAGLQKLRSMGRYEELWLGYLFAAEIHYQNTTIDRMNGSSQTYEITKKYFTLADEYAPLYRKSKFQMDWAKLQRNTYSLMFTAGEKEKIINEIYEDIPKVGDHFKTVTYGRLFNYFGSISDYSNAAACARCSIEIGERANTMMVATMAYGFLARIALADKNQVEALRLTRRFLQLCHENGIYEYFRMRKAYDPILEFAFNNEIEPEIVKQLMAFAGYRVKKAYITTLGGFSVRPYYDRQKPLKMRTKKERELLSFLLSSGSEGATKEQIYEALWYESNSDDIKKLIGVYLTHVKNDLSRLDVQDAIEKRGKYYSIRRDEIVVDTDLYEAAAQEFHTKNTSETAMKLISLYKGDYLAEFEAHWAINQRLRYSETYHKALSFINS
jgi:hypothetical protein